MEALEAVVTDIPQAAIDAAADAHCDWECGADPETCPMRRNHERFAASVTAAIERAWPHQVAQRSAESTVGGSHERGPLPKVRQPGSPPPRVPKYAAPAMDGIGFTATWREHP